MVNVIGFNWICSPACTELETIVLDQLAGILGIPGEYLSKGNGGGVIQQSASDATIVAMVAARQRALRIAREKLGDKYDENEVLSKLVCYVGEEAHSCHKKGAMVLKLRMKVLPTDNHRRLLGSTLEAAIKDDLETGLIPTFLAATIGSTSTGSTDDLEGLTPVCNKYGIWMHVDAAYAGAAFVCEEERHLMKGLKVGDAVADSYDYNPHKVRGSLQRTALSLISW